jgi:hypothetical protein
MVFLNMARRMPSYVPVEDGFITSVGNQQLCEKYGNLQGFNRITTAELCSLNTYTKQNPKSNDKPILLTLIRFVFDCLPCRRKKQELPT